MQMESDQMQMKSKTVSGLSENGSERESVSTPRLCWVSASWACWAAGRRSSDRLCFRTSDHVSGRHSGFGTRPNLSTPFSKVKEDNPREQVSYPTAPVARRGGMTQLARSTFCSESHPQRALIPH